MFRYDAWPTPSKYNRRESLQIGFLGRNLLIPQEYIKVPGMYYFSVRVIHLDNDVKSDEVIAEYDALVWKESCIGKANGIWSTHNCYSLETSDYDWTDCKCMANEITAYSIPLNSSLFPIPAKDLMEPYFNVLPLVTFLLAFLLYFVLLALNHHRDKMRNLTTAPVPLRDNNTDHKQLYAICVKTGMYFSSGTTASVFIVLHGMKRMTETRQLIDSKAEKFSFQKGSVDFFLISTEENLGPLIKVEVWHNNYGLSPSWYLRSISVKDLKTGLNYYFDCSKWLSAEKEDGQIERELTVSDADHKDISFCLLLWENFVTFIYDFNMWNSLMCDSPASFFSGVQRLTCCLGFFLNCAFLFAILQEQVLDEFAKDYSLPHITENTFSICILISAVATLPQILFTVLFRYSKTPNFHIEHRFSRLLCSLSLHHLYCWLRHKRSNSSRSTDRSTTSMEGSDSLYSSFEESSIMSIPEILEESFSSDEKIELPTSISSTSINDPVSPLQKTISTWQAFENWVKQKHDLILKSDTASERQQITTEKSDSVLIPEEIILDEMENQEENVNRDLNGFQFNNFGSMLSEHSGQGITCEENSNQDHVNLNCFLDAYLQLPFLHCIFYYVAWILLISNILFSLVFTLLRVSSFSATKCSFWLKHILIGIICSFLLITPFLALLLTIVSHVRMYLQRGIDKPSFSNSPFTPEVSKVVASKSEPSYKRMEYFKKYLRPPKEQILEQFRQYALSERNIFNFQSYIWQYVFILALLLSISFPIETCMKYYQTSSIFKTLFRSDDISIWNKSVNSSLKLRNWFESDFINRYYGTDHCSNGNFECGITFSTGCIIIGSTVMRSFKQPLCGHYTCKSSSIHNLSSNSSTYNYEHRTLKGHYDMYEFEDSLVVLDKNKDRVKREVTALLQNLNKPGIKVISIEFLLFNPSFSTFFSTSLLFEVTETEVLFSKEMLSMKLHDATNFLYHVNFGLHLVFMLITIIKFKNLFWQILKYGTTYWKTGWHFFSAIFCIFSISYIVVYVIYMIQFKFISLKLKEEDYNINVNITYGAYLEQICQNLLTFLIFLHLIGSVRLLYFSPRLKKLIKRILLSWEIILASFAIFILFISIFAFMTKQSIGVADKLSHPIINCIRALNSIFKAYGKPEIIHSDHPFSRLFSNIILFGIVAFNFFFLSFLKSIFMRSKACEQGFKNGKINLKETGKVFKKKFMKCFFSEEPQIVTKENYTLPVEFLLLQLEQLVETLLLKSDSLFVEKDNYKQILLEDKLATFAIEDFLNSKCQQLNKDEEMESTLPEIKNFKRDSQEPSSQTMCKMIEALVAEKLNATIPRQNRSRTRTDVSSSLNASLSSKRKFRQHTASLSLSSSLPHKIRKTYPLCQVQPDSSLSESTDDDAGNTISIRKTKSKGKGKKNDLNLTELDDSSL